MFDRYTKIVLTVIAAALSAIAIQGTIEPARAQMSGCGTTVDPCSSTMQANTDCRCL